MNNLLQTINGFDLFIGSTMFAIGLFVGQKNATAAYKLKAEKFLNWLEGESIETQMQRDGWKLEPSFAQAKKTRKK